MIYRHKITHCARKKLMINGRFACWCLWSFGAAGSWTAVIRGSESQGVEVWTGVSGLCWSRLISPPFSHLIKILSNRRKCTGANSIYPADNREGILRMKGSSIIYLLTGACLAMRDDSVWGYFMVPHMALTPNERTVLWPAGPQGGGEEGGRGVGGGAVVWVTSPVMTGLRQSYNCSLHLPLHRPCTAN